MVDEEKELKPKQGEPGNETGAEKEAAAKANVDTEAFENRIKAIKSTRSVYFASELKGEEEEEPEPRLSTASSFRVFGAKASTVSLRGVKSISNTSFRFSDASLIWGILDAGPEDAGPDEGWTLHNLSPIEQELWEESDEEIIPPPSEKTSTDDMALPFYGEAVGEAEALFWPGPTTTTPNDPPLQMMIPELPAQERLEWSAAEGNYGGPSPLLPYHTAPTTPEYSSPSHPILYRCPSVDSFLQDHKGPLVQLYLFPGHRMISKECRLDTHIQQIKVAIGRYVKIPPSHLEIRRRKNLQPDAKTLQELGAKPNGRFRCTVELNPHLPGNYEFNMPADHSPGVKPMFGGFFDKRNNKTFHHAQTQTDKGEKVLRESQVSVGSQVFDKHSKTISTVVEQGQQMERRGYYISSQRDRRIRARRYLSYDDLMAQRHAAARTIQLWWRCYLAQKERARREDLLIQRIKYIENVRMGRLKQRTEIISGEIDRQSCPQRLVDLELLYRAINVWRKEQEEFINNNRWGPERKAAFSMLASMEAELLLELERVKNLITVKEREAEVKKKFETMANPTRWLSQRLKKPGFLNKDDGGKAHVRELQGIYIELQTKVPRTEEGMGSRCALLSKLNTMTKHLHTKMSQLLTELVGRELCFLQDPKCRYSDALLAGVRKRISSTFFFLCQDPEFNPEATKISKIPYASNKLRKDMQQCKGCRRMQHRDQFQILKGTTVSNRCRSCMSLYRTTILRVDLNLHRQMLKELRREEMAAGVVTSVTFLIDAFDLAFLLDQIWLGQSALSGIDNRYLLRLCRWDKTKPWSPWNSVCLADEEATAHLTLDSLSGAYTQAFIHKVHVKQLTAKTYFEGIAKLMVRLDERVLEQCKTAANTEKRTLDIKDRIRKATQLLKIIS